jgi:transposase
MEAGDTVHLVHAPALPQYSGLKHADDLHDARWLAHLLRLGLLPTGYIYPKAARAVRDLLRKRRELVRHKTMVVLSLQSLLTRLTGNRLSLPRLWQLTPDGIQALVPFPEQGQSVMSSLSVLQCLEQEIRRIEGTVREAGRVQLGYVLLQTVPGIGPILAGTILLEAGDMRRVSTVGHFVSYCRCVGSQHLSNGKRKGAGNTKNGNKYLSWAFIEAAHVAIRYEAVIRRFYQRKQARTHPMVALKAVAHKLARAC